MHRTITKNPSGVFHKIAFLFNHYNNDLGAEIIQR